MSSSIMLGGLLIYRRVGIASGRHRGEYFRASQPQEFELGTGDTKALPLGNRLRRDIAEGRNRTRTTERINQEGVTKMFHSAHCNYSYAADANHSFDLLCNSGYMSLINERIKKYRTDLGLSQQEVADACKCSRVAVTKWENGATESMKLRNLVGMVKLFKVSFDELITGQQSKVNSGEPATEHSVQEQPPAFTYRLQGMIERLTQLPDNSPILAAIDLMLSGTTVTAPMSKAKRDNTAKTRSTLASRLGKYDESKTSVK